METGRDAGDEGEALPALGILDQLAIALGGLVINFAALEESLHDAIRVAINGNESTDALTAGLSFKVLVEKLGAVCVDLGTSPATPKEIRAFCDRLEKLNDRRNQLIHSTWGLSADRVRRTRRSKRSASAKGGFEVRVTHTSVAEVRAVADECIEADRKLWEIVPP